MKLNMLSVHINDFIDHQQKRLESRVEELQRENRAAKTDLALMRHKVDDAQMKYYAVSLIPRLLGLREEVLMNNYVIVFSTTSTFQKSGLRSSRRNSASRLPLTGSFLLRPLTTS